MNSVAQEDNKSYSQCEEAGYPKIIQFNPRLFKNGLLVHDIDSDETGTIYFANQMQFIHTFNGGHMVSSRIMPESSKLRVTAMEYARDTLWLAFRRNASAGTRFDLGYYTKDRNGQFKQAQYHSIYQLLPDSLVSVDIYDIVSTMDAIYFQVYGKGVLRYKNGQVKFWPVNIEMLRLSPIDNKVFFYADHLLYVAERDSILPVAAWNNGYLDDPVRAVMKHNDSTLMIIGQQGYYTLTNNSLKKLNDYSFKSNVICAVRLDNGHIALGTRGNGIMIVHNDGSICLQLTKAHGLNGNDILFLEYTSFGELWVGTNFGISLVNYPSPYSYFKASAGLTGIPQAIIRHNDTLYVATKDGLLFFSNENGNPQFKKHKNFSGLSILSVHKNGYGVFLCTDRHGTFVWRNGKTEHIDENRINDVLRLRSDSGLFLFKNSQGVRLYEKSIRDEWISHGKIISFRTTPGILEDSLGNIWLPTFDGVVQIHFNRRESVRSQLMNKRYETRIYDHVGYVNSVAGGMMVLDSQIYKYDHSSDEFVISRDIPVKDEDRSNLARIIEGVNNDLWFVGNPVISHVEDSIKWDGIKEVRHYARAIHRQDNYYLDETDYLPLYNELGGYGDVHPENTANWFIGSNGTLGRADLLSKRTLRPVTSVQINLIKTSDETLFRGNATHIDNPILIDYEENDVRISYAAVSFYNSDSVYYRNFLKGYDDDWSRWSHDKMKYYTKIPPGEYIFMVEATDFKRKNLATSFVIIKVTSPWYLTAWAYTGYFLVFVLFIGGLFQLRVSALEKDKKNLERIVAARTAQLEKNAKQLRAINEAKSRFFSNISHEFRTPLTLILGHIQKLFRSDNAAGHGRLYHNLDRNARQLLHLVNQLLELARLESGRITYQPVPTRLYRECDRIVASYSSLAESRNILLSFEFEMEHELCVLIDGEKFKSILINLLSNAFKFTYSGGKVTLRVKQVRLVEKEVTFVCLVGDTGKGIPEAHLSRIFDRFYQVEPNYTERAFGTGIGLSIVKDYVNLLNGTLEVSSKPECGTEFTLTFTAPLASSRCHEETEPVSITEWTNESEEESVEDSSEGVNILVVEDNSSMQEYIRDILAAEYNVALAADGRSGLDYAMEHLPDLIISDIMMPVMDGMQLLTELKNDLRTSHIPVIILTALSDRENKFKGLQQGADDYLVKPFDEEELKILIRNRLDQRKRIRESWKMEDSSHASVISSIDDKFLGLVQAMVEENLGNSHYGVNDLASDVGMSRSQLHRKLTALTNYSASNFIKFMRLQRARLLIQANSGTIAEIAYEVGFSSPQYFSHCFRQQYGVSPGKTGQAKQV